MINYTVYLFNQTAFIDYTSKMTIPVSTLGHVTKSEIRVDDASFGFISDYKKQYDNSLENIIEGKN